MRRPERLAALLALALAAPASAHPHVFIDGGVDFLFDAEGRVERLRITWIYDPLTSLFMLEDLGLDPAAAELSDEDHARLAAYDTQWQPGYDGDSYLHEGDRRIGLGGPLAADASVADGRVTITFERALDAPVRPQPEAVVAVYDPTYYTAFAITGTPRLEGAASGCRAEVIPFRPTASLRALQDELLAIPAGANPEEEVGGLFADRVRLTCD